MLRHLSHAARISARSLSATAVRPAAGAIRVAETEEDAKDLPLVEHLLIANRGEIACRVIQSARKMGIKTTAVFSEADRDARHVQLADSAYFLGPAPVTESYLRVDKLIEAAEAVGADAVHPGYGFISENADATEAFAAAGIEFVGPPGSAMRSMGDKAESKHIMHDAGVPCVPGYHGADQDDKLLGKEAEKMGFPVLIKAVMGGGGKGMRVVRSAADFQEALDSARAESSNAFGDDRVLVEKFLENPRHVEVQVFCDKYGNAVHVFERDCTLQRRHQKVIEEAPAPGMSQELRERMGAKAIAAARAVGYVGAGTVEFIKDDGSDDFYFMEMNTRLQVEHPVSELVSGVDLVKWQLEAASGRPLEATQDDLSIQGHSFEARIYAEDPAGGFLPQTGTLKHLRTPKETAIAGEPLGFANENRVTGGVIRVDTGVREGDEVSVHYDPMIAKLIVHDRDRDTALKLLVKALREFQVVGLPTNRDFLVDLAESEAFKNNEITTNFIERDYSAPDTKFLTTNTDTVVSAAVSKVLSAHNARVPSAKKSAGAVVSSAFVMNTPLSSKFSFTSESDDKPVSVEVQYSPGTRVETVDTQNSPSGSVGFTGPVTVTVDKEGEEALEVRAEVRAAALHPDGTLDMQVGNRSFSTVCVATPGDAEAGDRVTVFTAQGRDELVAPVFKGYVSGDSASAGSLTAPMPGKVTKVFAKSGAVVKKGDPLMALEAMKMEHIIRAPADGIVKELALTPGDLVGGKQILLDFTAEE